MIELRRADGTAYRGWTEATVSASIEDMARSFSFRQALTDDGLGLDLYAGAAVEVWVDDTPVVSGFVDTIEPEVTDAGKSIVVTGRSATAVLIEDSAPLAVVTRVTLAQLVAAYAGPLGLAVIDDARDGRVFARVRPTPGETCSAVILRLAAQRGLLVTDDETGAVRIMRADDPPPASGELRYGVNVLASKGRFTTLGRHRTYAVRGQSVGEASAITAGSALVTDPGAPRAGTLAIKPDRPVDAAGARALAEWEAVTRWGQAQEVAITVSGWAQADGRPWVPGETIAAWDPVQRLAGHRWLIVGVEFTVRNGEGRRTALRLQPPEAFRAYVPRLGQGSGSSAWLSAADQKAAVDAVKAGRR